MKLAHLTRRFFGALGDRPPAPADLAWAQSLLGPRSYELFARQAVHDQRHALCVARGVERDLGGTEHSGEPQWLAAALLHDCGKGEAGLGVGGRVVATVCGWAGAQRRAEAWSTRPGFAGRIGRYLRHPELGAAAVRTADGPEVAARWAEAHHRPAMWAQLPIPPAVVAALRAADDD
jgi:hypothetical protein